MLEASRGPLLSEESTFNSEIAVQRRNRSTWALFCGEASWIGCEAGWILLVPQLSIPLGALAFVFLFWAMLLDIQCSRRFEWWFPSVLEVLWLSVNLVWMYAEFAWDSPDEQTPWALTPLFGQEDDSTYNRVQTLCMLGFFCVPGTWLLSTGVLCLARSQTTSSRGARAIVIQAGHIALWALMDAAWACGLMWLAVTAGVATMVMLAMNLEPDSGGGLICSGADRADIAWIIWTASNLVWVLCELGCDDSLPVRYAASMLGLISLLLLLGSYQQVRDQEKSRFSQLFRDERVVTSLSGE
mmetsp:Transcript_35775/g.70907  ORF Transcript_35775/g.70907 Transcript_35775/m.70907 type:complete len:299 (+) Transcript_35775:43-939(+)|eukprot:CAMPEP_0172661964 /NCGR_PEP_ID=MMETSP1074-20121228/5060_1 /TAXON_ID=2916 /ORGANISM="Ceratium fusus, Strain PA161109" /LENGTH=298 /DNA_ID=CAMNT_0013477813 /DNA_START=48 /DNA_END=944 /DNA_ORIENTATION=+